MQRNKIQDAGHWEEEKQIHRRGAEYAEKKKRKETRQDKKEKET